MPEDDASSVLGSTLARVVGEFAIIVAGVTVALGADSLWTARQDRVRESEYLAQLRAELDENVATLTELLEAESAQREAAQNIYQGVASRAITRDSARVWLVDRRAGFYSDPRLLTGTITALIATGDLVLIRDAELRQGLAAYDTQIREDRAEFDRHVSRHSGMMDRLRSIGLESAEQAVAAGGSSLIEALVQGPRGDVLYAVDGIIAANRNRRTYLGRMLDRTEALRSMLP